jgi:hypothetical protein
MELPQDVLQIVREFSKPVFKHFRVYNQALNVLGRSDWTELKETLQTDERVVPEILAYLDAFLSKQEAQRQLDEYCRQNSIDLFVESPMNQESRDIYTKLYYTYWEKRAVKRQCSNVLFKRIYGLEQNI